MYIHREGAKSAEFILFLLSDYQRFRNAEDTGGYETLFPIANPNESIVYNLLEIILYGFLMAILFIIMCTNSCQGILFAVAGRLCGCLRQAGVPQTEQKRLS